MSAALLFAKLRPLLPSSLTCWLGNIFAFPFLSSFGRRMQRMDSLARTSRIQSIRRRRRRSRANNELNESPSASSLYWPPATCSCGSASKPVQPVSERSCGANGLFAAVLLLLLLLLQPGKSDQRGRDAHVITVQNFIQFRLSINWRKLISQPQSGTSFADEPASRLLASRPELPSIEPSVPARRPAYPLCKS